ncbi:sugar ABC transporter permease [Cryptosporangium aurantiacum]|uniref:D-xylose transport system permease protein n=1 Tax=Cryptosporangium aurantiacum TaxID=134849 RepID=A0A1M7JWX6_9ACTN|nr:ABC transporter permease [Cryptosporangium aurantiacum]SHM57037.1 D-xylose transport system permease protein [Cryptosporangium aurantiacum]
MTPTTPAIRDIPDADAQAFSEDVGPRNVVEAFRAYVDRVRGGEGGALPAVLGAVVLVVIFANASDVFLSKGNFANLLQQAAQISVLGMGMVFVLLIGEIDLSAGTAGGVCAAGMALALNDDGNLRASLGTGVFVVLMLIMAATVVLAALSRLWIPAAIVAIGIVIAVAQLGSTQLLAMFLSVAVGTSIGVLIGFLVARIGIPSFIVTLALFLAWQGALLTFIGTGAAIPTRRFDLVNNIENGYMPVVFAWVVWGLSIAAYLAVTAHRAISRRRAGLSAEPLDLVLVRVAAIAAVTGLAVYVLNQDRSRTVFAKIQGVPWSVLLVAVVFVFWTLILTRTQYGRFIYAVGGSKAAARRAGIDVARVRMSCFIICSGMAGLAGIIGASYLGGVPSDFGKNTDVLYAVGAAVIGGTSLFGGRGKIRDAIIGAIVIAMIPNGLNLIKNISSAYVFLVTGLVLLVAAGADALSRRRPAED